MPLQVLATPIGNLADVSPRARRALAGAELVAAEDTRVTRKLYAALGLVAPRVLRFSGAGMQRSAQRIADEVASGKRVVVVSDAGTPVVSDPGHLAVRACLDRGLSVEPIPGPSAAVLAVSVSGLPCAPFHVLGFPPRKPGPLRRWLQAQGALPGSLVLFESPQRTASTVRAIADVLVDREVCLCRELTKLHEEVLLGGASELADQLAARELKGEVTLVIGPGEAPKRELAEPGEGLRSIAQALADRWGVPRREAYQRLLELERSLGG